MMMVIWRGYGILSVLCSDWTPDFSFLAKFNRKRTQFLQDRGRPKSWVKWDAVFRKVANCVGWVYDQELYL